MVATRYKDSRGWEYMVMPGMGLDTFKARYHKPDSPENIGWKCVARLPWREDKFKAQLDLDNYAKKKGFKTVCRWEE